MEFKEDKQARIRYLTDIIDKVNYELKKKSDEDPRYEGPKTIYDIFESNLNQNSPYIAEIFTEMTLNHVYGTDISVIKEILKRDYNNTNIQTSGKS